MRSESRSAAVSKQALRKCLRFAEPVMKLGIAVRLLPIEQTPFPVRVGCEGLEGPKYLRVGLRLCWHSFSRHVVLVELFANVFVVVGPPKFGGPMSTGEATRCIPHTSRPRFASGSAEQSSHVCDGRTTTRTASTLARDDGRATPTVSQFILGVPPCRSAPSSINTPPARKRCVAPFAVFRASTLLRPCCR
jgi:hypothetical protein